MFSLTQKARRWFWQTTARRAPRAPEVTLRHRTIYVLPNGAGIGFFFTVLLLWLLGTNYQNNLVLAASFLLLSLFFVAVIHAFRNLSGLKVCAEGGAPVFAGDSVNVSLQLIPAPRSRYLALKVELSPDSHQLCDVLNNNACVVTLSEPVYQRGWYRPERLLISSRFPLGVIYAWSWVFLETRVLVYPQPLAVTRLHGQAGEGDEEEEGRSSVAGAVDDFQGFARYQPGASQAHIAWKHYARGAGLHLKNYMGTLADSVWLDFADMVGDTETRLSGLCYLALEWHRQEREYGLRLPDGEIAPASGENHLQAVLKALALYEQEGP